MTHGMKTLSSFPGMVLLAMAIQTARQTSQLHRTPLAKRVVNPMLTLATAILVTEAVRASEAVVPATSAIRATKMLPRKFPLKDQNQFFATSAALTLPVRRPLPMTKTFPVKSSPPVRMTMDRPAGRPIAPLTKLARPGLLEAKAGEDPDTTLQRRAPMPIRDPARKPRTRVLSHE